MKALRRETEELRLRFAEPWRKRPTGLTKFDWIALKTALEPYLKEEKPNWTSVHTALPQFSRRQISNAAYFMRQKRKEAETVQSDDDSVRVKDE